MEKSQLESQVPGVLTQAPLLVYSHLLLFLADSGLISYIQKTLSLFFKVQVEMGGEGRK